MSRPWPPGREDPGEGFPDIAEEPDATAGTAAGTAAEARLSEVSACLAAVPAPVIPDGVAARISAALAAEATARAELGQGKPGGDVRPAGHGSRTRRSRRPGRPPAARRPLLVAASLLACLVFAGVGLAMSRGASPQSSSASAGSAAAPVAGSPGAGSPAAGAGPAVTGPGPREQAPASAAGQPAFTVTRSGTLYRRATLAGQVAAVSAASVAGAGARPSARLLGCVLHLAGVTPELVDRASYQGTAAYVIATTSRVWVVGPGCSAAQPELIATVARAG